MIQVELSHEQKRSKKFSIIALVLMIVSAAVLDQVSKIHAEKELMIWADATDLKAYRGDRKELFTFGPGKVGEGSDFFLGFSFSYVRNQGAAWGFLSDLDEKFRKPFFFSVTILAVIIIALYLRTTPIHHRLARFALSLIFAGAIGNFLDRFRLQYVIDFIDVRWNLFGWSYIFPSFNLADSCITVGVSFLLYDLLVLETARKKSLKKA